MLLDACTSFCTVMHETLGPTLTELIMIGVLAAVGWWRARKHISKVEANAEAKIAVVAESASKAKAEVREAREQLARIEGSLRPAAITTPFPAAAPSSRSGTFEPVQMPVIESGTLGGKSAADDVPEPDLSGESRLPAPPLSPTIPAKRRP
jgi:hypothetical protein